MVSPRSKFVLSFKRLVRFSLRSRPWNVRYMESAVMHATLRTYPGSLLSISCTNFKLNSLVSWSFTFDLLAGLFSWQKNGLATAKFNPTLPRGLNALVFFILPTTIIDGCCFPGATGSHPLIGDQMKCKLHISEPLSSAKAKLMPIPAQPQPIAQPPS